MKTFLLAGGIFLLMLAPLETWALSLGELQVQSRQGEPLRARIPLRISPEDWGKDFRVSLGSRADYRELGVKWTSALESVSVRTTGNRKGTLFIQLSSKRKIEQPSLDLLMKVQFNGGTLLEKYTVHFLSSSHPPPASSWRTDPAVSGQKKLYGPVKRGETLLEIARKLGATDETLSRVVVALWENNQDAFISSNIHGLRAGSYLNYQNLTEAVNALSADTAQQILHSQWIAWKSGTQNTTSSTEPPPRNASPQSIEQGAPPRTKPIEQVASSGPAPQLSKRTGSPERIPESSTVLTVAATVETPLKAEPLASQETEPLPVFPDFGQRLDTLENTWNARIGKLEQAQKRLRREIDQKLLTTEETLQERIATLELYLWSLAGIVGLLILFLLLSKVFSWFRKRREPERGGESPVPDEELAQVLDL